MTHIKLFISKVIRRIEKHVVIIIACMFVVLKIMLVNFPFFITTNTVSNCVLFLKLGNFFCSFEKSRDTFARKSSYLYVAVFKRK